MASKVTFLLLVVSIFLVQAQLPPPPPRGCPLPPPPGAPPPPCPPPAGCPLPPGCFPQTTTAAGGNPTTTATTAKPATTTATTAKPATTTASAATTTTSSNVVATTTTSSSGGTSAFAIKVKALIDAGTCSSVVSTVCGDSATTSLGYYETFVYNGKRVVIISGVPKHQSEYSQTQPNPNKRCVRYQYVTLPLTPTKGSSYTATPMGATGYFTSGAVLYNPLSSPQGDLASNKEWVSLDPCYGHSSPDKQYHYHAISATCFPGAQTPSARVLLGYALDGFPVYGYGKTSSGVTLKSCWTSSLSNPTMMSDFTYAQSTSCHLDQANGYTFSDGYGYVAVADKYYVPYYYAGSTWGKICGFSA